MENSKPGDFSLCEKFYNHDPSEKVYYVKNRYNPIFLSISNDEKPTVISKANLMDHIKSYRTKEDFSIANPLSR